MRKRESDAHGPSARVPHLLPLADDPRWEEAEVELRSPRRAGDVRQGLSHPHVGEKREDRTGRGEGHGTPRWSGGAWGEVIGAARGCARSDQRNPCSSPFLFISHSSCMMRAAILSPAAISPEYRSSSLVAMSTASVLTGPCAFTHLAGLMVTTGTVRRPSRRAAASRCVPVHAW